MNSGADRLASPWVLLDRDGVINRDVGHVGSWDRFDFMPDAIGSLAMLRQAGLRLGVVTNQAGIARGLFDELEYVRTTAAMLGRLKEAGVHVEAVAHCPHHPDAARVPYYDRRCSCRKPLPGLIGLLMQRFPIAAPLSFMIGDRPTDMASARAAGLPSDQCFMTTEDRPLAVVASEIIGRLDSPRRTVLDPPLPARRGETTELIGDFMRKDKVEELIVSLNASDIEAVGGGATLSKSTVTAQNWDRAMLLGCCTQGCCGDQPQMV